MARVILTTDKRFNVEDVSGIPGVIRIEVEVDPEPQVMPSGKRTNGIRVFNRGRSAVNVIAVFTALKTGPKHYSVTEKLLRKPQGFSSLLRRQEDHGYLTFDPSTRMIAITEAGLARLAELETN